MKINDLFSLAVRNLWRRKLRTFLTVIGVFIGCVSIIVMTSLGLAQKKSQEELFASNTSLTSIQVSPKNYYDPMSGAKPPSKGMINDAAVKKIKEIKGVKNVVVTYVLNSSNAQLKFGKYMTYGNVSGLEKEALTSLGIEVKDGKYPEEGKKDIEVLVSNDISHYVYDPNGGGREPKEIVLNLKRDRPILTIGNLMNEKTPLTEMSGESNGVSSKSEKIKLKIVGTFDRPPMGHNLPAVILNPLDVKKVNERAKKLALSEEDYKKQKRIKSDFYESITVYANKKEEVSSIVKEIENMELSAYYDSQWIENAKSATNLMMIIFAGIGSISLIVAAIGITNTMVMSIHERTKEIGVMKVIGASVKDIRNLFLLEAGFIGLIGGIFGVILSYGISYGLNKVIGPSYMASLGMEMEKEPVISLIPIALAMSALIFSFLIGLITGYLPARRATKISAIEAIKTE